VLLS
jgi:hypothetical protein